MSGRVEIITGPERRRRWSEEEKLQLVEDGVAGGAPARHQREPAIRLASLGISERTPHRLPIGTS